MNASGEQRMPNGTNGWCQGWDGTDVAMIRLGCSGVLCSIGFVTNLLSVAVFRARSLRQRPYVHILTALALLSNVVLIYETLDFAYEAVFHYWNVPIIGLSSTLICKLFWFSRKTIYIVVSWLMIVLCADRMVVLYWPLKRQWYMTIRKIRKICVLIATLAAASNVIDLMWMDVAPSELLPCRGCQPQNLDESNKNVSRLLHQWLFVPLYYYVPALIIVVTNILLARKIRKAANESIRITARRNTDDTITPNRSRRHRSYGTMTLLYVTSLYIIVALPVITMMLISLAFPAATQWSTFTYVIQSAEMLKLFNYADGFLIYVLSGARFRDEFYRLALVKWVMSACGCRAPQRSARMSEMNSSFATAAPTQAGRLMSIRTDVRL